MLINDLRGLTVGETFDLGKGFRAFRTTYNDIDIHKIDENDDSEELAAWLAGGEVSIGKLRFTKKFERNADLRSIINKIFGDEPAEEENALRDSDIPLPDDAERFLPPKVDVDKERKLCYLQGQVDVYERLISGGFTNLSK